MVKRSNSHVLAGLGFLVAGILVAGAIYFGLKNGLAPQNLSASAPKEVAAKPNGKARTKRDAPAAVATLPSDEGGSAWLVGTWASADSVGVSDRRRIAGSCETDNVVTFNANGTYEEGGNYEEDDGSTSGHWSLRGSQLTYRANNGETLRSTVKHVARYAMMETGYRGSKADKMVRCAG